MKSKRTARFRRSLKRLAKRNKNSKKLITTISQVYFGTLLPQHKDHALKGNWKGHRECHIESDWLLVYRWEKEALVLVDTGSHADVFGM